MKKTTFSIILFASATAAADPTPTPPSTSAAPDLTVHAIPAKKTMSMRPKSAAKQGETTTAQAGTTTTSTPTPTPAPTASADASTSAHFDRIPTKLADLRERVMFRFNAGYQLDDAPASGDTLRGGAALPPGFSASRQWISGDLVVGAKDIIAPSLGGYFLSSYQFDTSDTLATRTALVVPGDASDQRIVIKAGYAEYQTDDKNNAGGVWLRAGRQFRLDGGAMFAYFDGATVGYRTPSVSVSAFGGQRVSLYLDPTVSATSGQFQPPECVTGGIAQAGTTCQSNPGILFGATLDIDLKKAKGIPVKIGLNYMGLAIDSASGVGDTPINTTSVSDTRSMIAATANIDVSKQAHLDLRARFVDLGSADVDPATGNNNGFAFGRAGARLRLTASKDLMVVVDVDQRGAHDYAYDLAAASQVDVVDVSRRLGVLTAPVNATLVSAHADWRKGNKEAILFGRINVPEDTVHFADQQGYEEVGAGVAGAPAPSTWVTGQYTFRHYDLTESTFDPVMGNCLTVCNFDDTSGSGLRDMHELAVDGWWRSSKNGNGQLRIGAGAFYRVYDLETPYVQTDTEGRGGGRADFQYWLTRELHVLGAAEVAQPSPTLMREIGTMSSVRIALEARW